MNEKLKYGAYFRKSTEEEERQKLSISSQQDKVKEYFNNLKISETFTESKSAFEPKKRPEFERMLELLDTGKINAIVAWHPDRLSRNEIDAAEISWRIRKGIIQDLKFASGFTFENTPEGIMMLQLTMSQSQYFSAKLSKDIRRGNEKKRSMGQLTGRAPEGYLNAGRRHGEVTVDPERFDMVRKAYDLFLTGDLSVPNIQTIMNEEWGYRTLKRYKSGGKPLSRSALYNMFRNVRYAGLVPDPYVDPDDPKRFIKATYPAMITPEEYDRVQVLLGRRGLPRLASHKQFALRGFIRCGDCDCVITAQEKRKQLANGMNRLYVYYHCTAKRKGCTQKSIYVKEDDLYKQLLDLLDNYELVPEMYDWAMQAFRDFADQEIEERNSVQKAQHKAIADTQAQLDKLLDMASRNLLDDDEYRTKKHALRADLKRLQSEQAETADRVKNWYEIATKTFEKLTYAGEKFKAGDLGNKRDILMAIGQNPVLIGGELQITPNEWLLPVAKSAKRIRTELEMVRTMPEQIQKASKEALRSEWCRERDLNPRRHKAA